MSMVTRGPAAEPSQAGSNTAQHCSCCSGLYTHTHTDRKQVHRPPTWSLLLLSPRLGLAFGRSCCCCCCIALCSSWLLCLLSCCRCRWLLSWCRLWICWLGGGLCVRWLNCTRCIPLAFHKVEHDLDCGKWAYRAAADKGRSRARSSSRCCGSTEQKRAGAALHRSFAAHA